MDCCKLRWKNCPKSWKGQFYNPKDSKLAVISVEAWCDSNLYLWHWFAGRPGTNNDLTTLDSSPLFNDILANQYDFKLQNEYTLPSLTVENSLEKHSIPYFLTDAIYLRWKILSQPIYRPETQKQTLHTANQEAVHKDIERFFGVIQARFNILRIDSKSWYLNDIIKCHKPVPCCTT